MGSSVELSGATQKNRNRIAAIPEKIPNLDCRALRTRFMVLRAVLCRSANAPAIDELQYSWVRASAHAPVRRGPARVSSVRDKSVPASCGPLLSRAAPGLLA